MKEKLMVQIGKDNEGNPIYKHCKKLYIKYFDYDNLEHIQKAKPFFNGQRWMIKAFGKLFFINPNDVFYNSQKKFHVLVKPLEHEMTQLDIDNMIADIKTNQSG